MKPDTKNHIGWVDLLRVVACFLVIISHCCDPFVGRLDTNYPEFLTGALVGSFVRPCVPLFVMMSAVLLLPINMDMKTFYSKRAKRLLLPFLFWSIVLPILYFIYVNSGIQIVNPNIDFAGYTWEATVRKIYTFIFNFNYDTTALWYVYMLIGLYLFMPVLSAWLKQAAKGDIQWFLRIWIISTILPYIQIAAPYLGFDGNGGNPGLLGVCDWNVYGTFYYFSGFIGYVVLAYYLVTHPLNWNWGRTLTTGLTSFFIGYAITGGVHVLTQHYFPGDFPKLEIPWSFTGINVLLMTFGVFIIMQKVNIKSSPLLKKSAALTYGIYLCHFIIVQMGYDLIYPYVPVPAFVKIILMAIFSFSVSYLVTWLMSLNKITRRFVM